jgi:hypothetical protein
MAGLTDNQWLFDHSPSPEVADRGRAALRVARNYSAVTENAKCQKLSFRKDYVSEGR